MTAKGWVASVAMVQDNCRVDITDVHMAPTWADTSHNELVIERDMTVGLEVTAVFVKEHRTELRRGRWAAQEEAVLGFPHGFHLRRVSVQLLGAASGAVQFRVREEDPLIVLSRAYEEQDPQ